MIKKSKLYEMNVKNINSIAELLCKNFKKGIQKSNTLSFSADPVATIEMVCT